MDPSVGRVVHYVSYGTPGGEYTPQCRAAIVTEVAEPEQPRLISLAVLNPSGLFFNQMIEYDDGKAGGTWHWPERIESGEYGQPGELVQRAGQAPTELPAGWCPTCPCGWNGAHPGDAEERDRGDWLRELPTRGDA